MFRPLKKLYDFCVELVLPSQCVGCKKPHTSLCNECIESIPRHTNTLKTPIAFTALFSYNSQIMRSAIWSLKYKQNRSLAKVFGTLLHDKMLEDMSEKSMFHSSTKLLIIPIPLHPKRKRQRGFNQSELIAREIFLKDTTIFTLETNVLYRYRNTPHQARIQNRKERMQNVRDCFAVKNLKLLNESTVILIDDVTTTGATLAEATRILKKSGAKRVYSYCIAH